MATLFDTRLTSIINIDSSIEVGAKLYWYVWDTSTPAETFTTDDLDVANANPVVAVGDGRFPAIWLAPGEYKYILTAADGTPEDPILTQKFVASVSQNLDVDPDLIDFLAGNEGLPVENGGTGPTLILPIEHGGTGQDDLLGVKSALGIPAVATGAEVITGTDNAKFISPLALADSVTTTLTANGSRIGFDGMVVQWGATAIGSGANVVTGSIVFPIPFPTAAFSITGNVINPANGSWHPVVIGFPTLSTTGADYFADTALGSESISGGNSIRWIAIGH